MLHEAHLLPPDNIALLLETALKSPQEDWEILRHPGPLLGPRGKPPEGDGHPWMTQMRGDFDARGPGLGCRGLPAWLSVLPPPRTSATTGGRPLGPAAPPRPHMPTQPQDPLCSLVSTLTCSERTTSTCALAGAQRTSGFTVQLFADAAKPVQHLWELRTLQHRSLGRASPSVQRRGPDDPWPG